VRRKKAARPTTLERPRRAIMEKDSTDAEKNGGRRDEPTVRFGHAG
jgi:hypothetical protein